MGIQAERRRQIESEASSKSEAERELRAFEIFEIGKKAHLEHHVVVNAISDEKMSVSDFTSIALETLKKREDIKHASQVTDRFSMRQLILDKAEGHTIVGANREVIDNEMMKERGREPVNGLLLPQSVFKPKRTKRDLTAGVDSAGGYLVDDSLADLIQPLDPDLPMLSRVRKTYGTKPFSIPRKLTKTEAEWVGETAEPAEQTLTFDEIKQRPHNLVGWVNFSKELLLSSSVEVEDLVRSDLKMALAIGAEKALLKATGVNQPLGLEANTDIRTITRSSGSAVTEDECLEAEESVLSSNAVISSPDGKSLQSGENQTNMRLKKAELAWVVAPKFRRLCKKNASLDGGSGNLWSTGDTGSDAVTIHRGGSVRQPTIIDHDAYVSTFVNDDQAWLGDWSQIVLNYFSSPQILVDPYTLSTRSLVRVTVSQFLDFHIRHADAVVKLSA